MSLCEWHRRTGPDDPSMGKIDSEQCPWCAYEHGGEMWPCRECEAACSHRPPAPEPRCHCGSTRPLVLRCGGCDRVYEPKGEHEYEHLIPARLPRRDRGGE